MKASRSLKTTYRAKHTFPLTYITIWCKRLQCDMIQMPFLSFHAFQNIVRQKGHHQLKRFHPDKNASAKKQFTAMLFAYKQLLLVDELLWHRWKLRQITIPEGILPWEIPELPPGWQYESSEWMSRE